MNSATTQVIAATTSNGAALHPFHLIYLVLFGVVGVALLVLFVRVLVSILTSDRSLGAKVVWVLFALWLPVLTWILWYTWGRPTGPRRPDLAL